MTSVFLAMVLAACGGGSGGGSTPQPDPQEAPTITTPPDNQSVVTGETATFTVVASNGTLSYQWQRNGNNLPDATASTYTTPATSIADNGAVFSVSISNGTGSVTSTATLTVSDQAVAPAITIQPENQTAITGQTATFLVRANGTSLRYQWQKNGTDIPGATSGSYTTPATSSTNHGAIYSVSVSNSLNTVTSSMATLTVSDSAVPPAITSQPVAQTVTEGQSTTFSVTATGTTLRYQWKKAGNDISGATSSTYTTDATVIGDNNAVFSVVVSNALGLVTSDNATLSVTPAVVSPLVVTPTITHQPAAGLSLVAGQSASFSVTATGTSLSYQWKKNGTDIPGATASSYHIPVTSMADSGTVYSVVVSNSAGAVNSSDASLTVTPATVAPSISTQPVAKTVSAGLAASFTVTATGTGPLAYQWKKGGNNIPGATSNSYTTPATSLSDSGAEYSVSVSNNLGTATSNMVILTVTMVPVFTEQPTDQAVNPGAAATFSANTTGSQPISYQWRKNGTNIPNAISRTYTTPPTSSTNNDERFTVVVTNSFGTVTSNEARLTVYAPPAIGTQPAAQTAYTSLTATFSVTATGTAPLTYQWQKNGIDIAGATSSIYTTPATSSADIGETLAYSVVVTNSLGTASSNSATLTVSSRYSRVANASGGTYDLTECVKDNSTGLVWEGKNPIGSSSRAGDAIYTNFDSTTGLQKADGSNATQTEIDASTNSAGYVNSVKSGSGLCGYTDWRLPTKNELLGIVLLDQVPTIDSAWFPNTQTFTYWTSTPGAVDSYKATYVNFLYGIPIEATRSGHRRLRLVR
ncbi:MAG: DUF1566 domain-containing protein [Rhodoferax sp.]|nr:DUF1566 domain-containing protein [Rhodoferax sp.]